MDDTIIVTCPSCKNYIEIKKKKLIVPYFAMPFTKTLCFK